MPTIPIFEKKNILVTGGAGFIGSHLCDELVKDNKVICIDNFISGVERNIDHLLQNPNFEFIRADITQPLDLENLPELEKFQVRFQGIQEIYHLACPTSPKEFDRFQKENLLANSLGVLNMLGVALKFKAKFLQASSSVVYGSRDSRHLYFKETDLGLVDPISPRSSYDEGKRFAESCTMTYRLKFELDAKIVRIFRTYGPRMKLEEGHMIPDFVNNALDNKDLIIYGDENFTTSLTYVSDIVSGLIKIMESEEAGPLNLGTPYEYKIMEVAQKIIEFTGSKSKIKFTQPLLFMTPLGLPDITLAKEKLAWFPVVLLDEGLKKTIDDLRAAKGLLEIG